ncbi:restriction endonuclease subunit S [Methylomonas sp. Kb3]|uniref:restriction endonuclease subunit S n=1 Tax=Methylomonas sp. Kb3 TaxID=1611544 RepID=UPI000C32481D|nr:restriction endonuclease subunit S [Methylomonas sp. Kb3]PKD39473.1 restriction endonuclease subunit S [Methylomonas sp. Kb3]
MLPKGWKKLSLAMVAEVRTGVAKGKQNLKNPVELPYLRVANVQDGYIDISNIKTIQIEQDQIERYSLKAGDVLMTEGGDFDKLGRGDVWNGEISPCLHQNHVFAVRTDHSILTPHFLAALSASRYGKAYFLSCAKKSTNLASINSTQLKEFPVLLPPTDEQQKITRILSVWDQAISTTEKLLTNSQQQKKALIQQLLTGKQRLPNFQSTSWTEYKFKDIFDRITTRNVNGDTNVLTISGRYGLISQKEAFNRVIASDDLSNYILLKKGDFAFNKSYSIGYPFGAIKPLERYSQGIVSALYLCFGLKKPSNHNHDFFRHFFEGGYYDHEIYAIAQEGARNHGLLNVSVTDFFNGHLRIPGLEEQIKIANVINKAEQEVLNFEAQLKLLTAQKKFLMQQLLTGKRRVKVDES